MPHEFSPDDERAIKQLRYFAKDYRAQESLNTIFPLDRIKMSPALQYQCRCQLYDIPPRAQHLRHFAATPMMIPPTG